MTSAMQPKRAFACGSARILLACALCLVAQGSAQAESPWEISLPGEPLLSLDAHSLSLGGATDARWELEGGLPTNPAQTVRLDGFTFATVLQLRRSLRDLPGGDTWDETRQDFPAFQVTAQLPRDIRLGVGYRAELRSRGRFTLAPVDVPGETVQMEQTYTQEGGLLRFPLTLAMPLGDRLRVGLGVSLLRGHLSQDWLFSFTDELTFTNPELGLVDRRTRRKASWHGTSFGFGLQWRPLKRLTAAARFDSEADVNGGNEIETAGETELDGDVVSGVMPARWAFSTAWETPFGGIISVQYEHEGWADAEMPVGDAALLDVDLIGVGFEYVWRLGRRDQKKLPLRLGFRMGNRPSPDPFTGDEIEELLYSIGTGVDLREGRGSLDLSLFHQSSSVAGGDSESRFGIALSLRTSELWTKRTTPF